MSLPKLWYIPGWAAARDGDCHLVRKLRSDFQVEVIWLPDYGNPDAGAPTQAIYAEAVAERLHRESSPVTVVGWSLGGMVALEVAATVPSALNGLVLLSTTAKFCSEDNRLFGPSPEAVARMMASICPETLRRFFMTCYRPLRPCPAEVDAKVQGAFEASSDQLRLGLAYLLQADLRPILPDVQVPTIVIHGQEDAVVPVQAAAELARTVRTIGPAILAGSGHMLPDICSTKISDLAIGLGDPNRAQ